MGKNKYRRLRKTYINLLATNIPETFLENFPSEEEALQEYIDTVLAMSHAEGDLDECG